MLPFLELTGSKQLTAPKDGILDDPVKMVKEADGMAM